MASLPLMRIRVADTLLPPDDARLPFLKGGPVEITLESALTVLVGENGSGKTTLLEAVAARCSIRPFGGDSYRETEDERPETAASRAVTLTFATVARAVGSCALTAYMKPSLGRTSFGRDTRNTLAPP
jgi:ABC-type cobalamin/Fe3+-siderophores transport system ATPase subunit